ncbi:MAG: ATP-grasp domain-containing protein [Aureliella sp.]
MPSDPPLSPRLRGKRNLGLVGYSTRALAEAATELGFAVSAIDAFGDQDLLDIAECHLAERWPHDIIARAREVACDGWLLGGGMENHGRLVASLTGPDFAEHGRVLGPTRSQLATLRSLRYWRKLAEHVPGLRMPRTFRTRDQWAADLLLFKPRRSSGGINVREASAARNIQQPPRGYWQEFIAGRVLGATTLIDDSGARFIGATESLSADQWPGPQPYIYRGSLGPIELRPEQRAVLLAMAMCVGEELAYRGYLQADLIEDAEGQLWLLELNPRWTAGMEVLHACAANRASSPLAAHLRAFGIAIAPSDKPRLATPATLAKAILYAERDLQLSPDQRHSLQTLQRRQALSEPALSDAAWWNIADVPALGDASPLAIQAGQPILTLRVGLSAPASEWAQARQSLLDGLNVARAHVLQRVFEPA